LRGFGVLFGEINISDIFPEIEMRVLLALIEFGVIFGEIISKTHFQK
jgi:hypothetical protein